jgi:hypothetical protein
VSQALSNLAVGSKVKFGKYQVNTEKAQPIIWTIVAKNHVSTPAYPSNSVTLHAAEILDLRCFDAEEPSNSNSDRQKYGNNRYSASNLDQWLNKDAAGGAWYSAAHSADHSPDTTAGTGGYGTQYAARPGFLNGFTDDEKAAILSTTIRVVKPSIDGGSYEDVVRKVFLPSTTEVGLSNENSIAEGAAWGYYTSNTARIGYVTQHCFSNTPSSSKPSSKTTAWYWWLRTPRCLGANGAQGVNSAGSLYNYNAYNGSNGVRPALNLSSSQLVSDTTDSDGCYTVVFAGTITPPAPATITVPSAITAGDSIAVSWGAVSGADSYTLERSANGGDFTQIYSGIATSYADTALATWSKVQYRVASVKDNVSSDWTTSVERTVEAKEPEPTAPSTPETITVPALTAGQTATISWAGVSNAAGYALQRSVDGASYMTVYRGENTSYIDTVGSAWLTVQYRVCAYDSNNNSSDYKTSDVFSVAQPIASLLEAIRAHTEQDIKITFADNTVLGKADVAITGDGVKITDILNGDTDYTFGKAVCKQVEMTLFNVDNKFNNFDFTQEFTLQIGVKVGAAFQYVTVGVFKGERPDKVRGKLIDFTAYDRMQKFEVSASDFIENMTFPVTLGAVFSSLCAAVGVEPITTTFTNSTKNFTFNPFSTSDYTAREVLAWIAEAAGCYARVNADGKVELNTFTTNSYKILKTDRFEMSESEFETPVIGKLECYTSYGDQLVTAGTGTNTYVISDNPFLYIENDTEIPALQPYVNAIYAKASLFPAYSPIAVRAEWYPEIKCGDIITVVNDYDEVKTLPIFSQTIKWNGFGKVEYESTGGLVREIEPVQQRELEAIKKSMLRDTDLSTAVESYLNTQEGKASITSAVEGKFVEVSSGSTITTTTAIEQLIQKTEKGIESKISLSASYGSGTIGSNVRALLTLFANADSSSIRLSANALDLTATETAGSTSAEEVGTYDGYPDPDGNVPVGDASIADYEFTKTSDGYYTSQNAGVHKSFSYGGLKFNFTKSTAITIRCISYGEAEHDYGIVSNLDTMLEWDNKADATGVKKAFSGENESSSSYVDLTMTVPPGSHFITFKYIKDSSVHKNGDYFKIKCFIQKTSRGKATISLKSGNVQISSADINFNGLVTFTDLSTSGATTIDGGNVTTDNLYVNKVFFAENENYTIVTSKMSAQNGVVQVGVQSPISGMAAFLELYGSFIYFIDPDSSSTNYQLQVQTANRKIIPGGNGYWDIGGVQNYFKTLYVEKIIFGDNSSQTTAP